MARVGIVTCEKILPYAQSKENPLYTHDDLLFVQELRRRGHVVTSLVWRNPPPTTGSLDYVIQRSPWDYMEDKQTYLQWLQALQQANIPFQNSYEITTWNIDKHYLQDLEKRGVPIVPTIYHDPSDHTPLADVMTTQGWSEMVVKPVVSAGAKDTFRLSTSEARSFQDTFEQLQRGRVFMLQPFLQEVLTEGEWSLIFFHGQYSHAVRKRAKAGDYRVQDDHGGKVHFDTPTLSLIQQAQQVVEAVDESLLYARVDGIVVNNTFLLVELELIEPELFLRADPQAASRFVDGMAL